MPRAPDEKLIRFSEDEAQRLIRLYSEAERDIIKEINRCLLKGNQTAYLKAMLRNTQALLDDLKAGSRDWCEKSIPRVYIEGAKAADMQMKAQGTEVVAGFGTVHQQAAKILADSAFTRFDDVTSMIGRRVDDIYRKLALENVRASTVGYQSWQKVARNYRQQLADEGVTGFTDRAGKKWDMTSYAKMVSRTTTMEAHLEGTKTRLLENGHDLVQISKHSNPCPKCAPWEGKIVSLSGNDKDYPSMDDARASGIFHPNCRHAYGLYIDIDAEIERMEKEEAAVDISPPKVDTKNMKESKKGDTPMHKYGGEGYRTPEETQKPSEHMLKGRKLGEKYRQLMLEKGVSYPDIKKAVRLSYDIEDKELMDYIERSGEVSLEFLKSGIANSPMPQYVAGWRFGDLPVGGISKNYASGDLEAGASMVEVYGVGAVQSPLSLLGIIEKGGRPRVEVDGWLVTSDVGSDGEPLIVGGQKIEKGIKMNKTSLRKWWDNTHYKTANWT